MNVAGRMIGIGSAAAGAVQLRPAVRTVGTGIDIALAEFLAQSLIRDAMIDIAEAVCLIADELMAWIKIAPGSDGDIFRSGTASGDALVDAWSVLEVDHVVIEHDRVSLLLPADHILGKDLILIKQDREIFFGQG